MHAANNLKKIAYMSILFPDLRNPSLNVKRNKKDFMSTSFDDIFREFP